MVRGRITFPNRISLDFNGIGNYLAFRVLRIAILAGGNLTKSIIFSRAK